MINDRLLVKIYFVICASRPSLLWALAYHAQQGRLLSLFFSGENKNRKKQREKKSLTMLIKSLLKKMGLIRALMFNPALTGILKPGHSPGLEQLNY